MTLRIIKSAVSALFISALCVVAARGETLRIGTEGTYRPWTMAGAGGNITGFDAVSAMLFAKSSACNAFGRRRLWKR